MAGKATRYQIVPGGRLKRWRNKQSKSSCIGEKHFDIGYHPDQIISRIVATELPLIETVPTEPDEPPIKVGHGRFRRIVQMVNNGNHIVACCA